MCVCVCVGGGIVGYMEMLNNNKKETWDQERTWWRSSLLFGLEMKSSTAKVTELTTLITQENEGKLCW